MTRVVVTTLFQLMPHAGAIDAVEHHVVLVEISTYAPRVGSDDWEGGPYVICQVRLMRGCVVSCRGLGACAGVVSVRGGVVVVVVWVPPGW